jgi:peptide/nickel transport system substrate-binding protein
MANRPSELAQEYAQHLEQQRNINAEVNKRRLFLKGSTLAMLGGGAALSEFLAACSSSSNNNSSKNSAAPAGTKAGGVSGSPLAGSASTAGIGTPVAKSGALSPYPLVDKYNWQRLDWGGKPTRGGEIIHGGAGTANWDLMKTTTLTPAPPYYNGLYYFLLDHAVDNASLNGQVFAPDLAIDTQHTPDFQTWTFKIPGNVFFHNIAPVNGRQMTADDIVYSYQRYIDASAWAQPLAFIDKITAPDPTTVRMDLKFPYFPVPNVVGMPYYLIFAKEHFEGNQDTWNQQPIGTGPFQVNSFTFRQVTEAVRHPKYHQKDSNGVQLPYADKLTGRYYADINASQAAFVAGQLDVMGDASSLHADGLNQLTGQLKDANYVVSPHWATYQTWYLWQWNNPLFKDARVRRALSMALDRKAIVDQALGGAGTAPTPIPFDQMGMSQAPYYDYMPAGAQYNPTMAKSLLAEAGYANGFKTKIVLPSQITTPPEVLAMQKAWADVLKVDLTIETKDILAVLSDIQKKSFTDLSYQSGIVATEPWALSSALFSPDSAQNAGNVNDPQLSQLIDTLKTTTNPDQRAQLAQQINTRVLDDATQLFIDGYHTIGASRPWLHEIAQSLYTQIDNWGGSSWRYIWIDGKAPNNRGGK